MQITATYTFKAPPTQVWTLLMDTDAIAACMPGCRGFRPLGDDRYEAELTAGVAAVSGDFKATIALLDKVPPVSYKLRVEANGRTGFVKGEASVVLTASGNDTSVAIVATADAGGMIARVGQRLIEGVARMSMDRFFGCLAAKIQPIPTS
jgi:carbon monoxide dehydrogenase subunit G